MQWVQETFSWLPGDVHSQIVCTESWVVLGALADQAPGLLFVSVLLPKHCKVNKKDLDSVYMFDYVKYIIIIMVVIVIM